MKGAKQSLLPNGAPTKARANETFLKEKFKDHLKKAVKMVK